VSKSEMERLRSGERIEIDIVSGGNGYAVTVTSENVVLVGCDCASSTNLDEVKRIHAALGAFLRIQKGKD
jgi:hypothetical protein